MKLKKGYLWSHSSEKRKRETCRGFEMQMHLDSPTVSRVSVLEGMWELECPANMSSEYVRRICSAAIPMFGGTIRHTSVTLFNI